MTGELLDEVLAHPDDDSPRRVYADWLAKTWRDLTRLELESYLPDADIAAIASSRLAPGLVHLELDVKYRDIGEARSKRSAARASSASCSASSCAVARATRISRRWKSAGARSS